MKLAEKFDHPVVVFVDTPAAYPGIESEERGVAEAIAVNLREMSMLAVPVVVIVTGEGGSGGALGLAIGDRVLIQKFAIYSVIPPEGCAAILWRDPARKVDAAEALKIRPEDLVALQVVDEIIPEPVGGAHTDPAGAAELLASALRAALESVAALPARGAPRTALREIPAHGRQRTPRGAGSGARTVRAVTRPATIWQHLPCDDARVTALARALDVDPVVARLLVLRGVDTPEIATRFLRPSLDQLHDPFLLTDLPAGVERLLAAIARKERIAVHGDYDVDGHHVDGDVAPDAGIAGRGRRALHP